jgi:ubiquitin carboxyl-terminal hydrolase 4/11/15
MPIDKSVTNRDVDRPRMDLDACLKCLSDPTILDETDEWFCPHCRKPVRATAQLDLWSVPDIVIFHLKRFVQRETGFKKVSTKIEFPEEVDLAPYVRGPQKNDRQSYKLYASIHHTGSMIGGHYTASVLMKPDLKFWTFNDETVYPAPKHGSVDTAYVLMYRRELVPGQSEPWAT